MDFTKVLKSRRSVRRFAPRKVSDGIVLEALEAALWAPSAGNVQDKEFVVVRDKATKEELVSAVFDQVWVARAPVIIVLISNVEKLRLKFRNRAELYATVSSGASLQNMLLCLASKGLQGTHVGLFDESKIKRILKVPDGLRVFSVIALGYPAEKPPVPQRADLKEITSLEAYGNKWTKGLPRKTYVD